ncbi:hypothetical protein FRUB_03145 [Fimbriiglobus ruber]|uniref:phosphoglycolate phosphatase n=1 Tax=Fimbriiglobus ruber TaxID=1908690 RepID=A0A225E0M7_9BACT|nr:hypothetical protein FRUB_03145 [Fimbriiglobus ruber]
MFDFDGTLSLVREGWARVMAELGRDLFRERGLETGPENQFLDYLEDQMLRLSGKPTIFQMQKLADEIAARGAAAPNADDLLAEFLRRLFAAVGWRMERLKAGTEKPADWVVKGAHGLLDDLRGRGVALYLASGTDLAFVRAELDALQLADYFGRHVYAPADNTPHYSKRDVIEMILRDTGVTGPELLGFGDGYSETVEVKRAGGVMVAVASVEPGRTGVNQMKRSILVELGADVVVPDYSEYEGLVAWLFADK